MTPPSRRPWSSKVAAALAFGILITAAHLPRVTAYGTADEPLRTGYINGVYMTNWGTYNRNFQPADLAVHNISHVFYAFLSVDADGTVHSNDQRADLGRLYDDDVLIDDQNNAFGCINQLFKLKRQHRHIKTMLSIGGGTRSANFSAATSTPGARRRFAKTAVDLLKDWGFDGIDIDWEYVRNAAEAQSLVDLLLELRTQLDHYAAAHDIDFRFLLSMAAPASTWRYGRLRGIMPELGAVLDFASLMAYDFAGDWSDYSGHHANLFPSLDNPASTPFNANAAVLAYIQGGVPAHKLVLGIPTFGRTFDQTRGIGNAYADTGLSSRKYKIRDYKTLPMVGANVIYDVVAKASFSYNAHTQQLVSYDTPRVVKDKTRYIKDKGLAGAMFWEASADRSDSESLIKTSHEALAQLDVTNNCIDYPASVYDNIRQGNQVCV